MEKEIHNAIHDLMDEFQLYDFIYTIREQCDGDWDAPAVCRFGEICNILREYTEKFPK